MYALYMGYTVSEICTIVMLMSSPCFVHKAVQAHDVFAYGVSLLESLLDLHEEYQPVLVLESRAAVYTERQLAVKHQDWLT